MRQTDSENRFPSIQFVDCSAKLTNGAAIKQKTAKSHAARYGHAKARREQQLRNQADRASAENAATEMINCEDPHSSASKNALWMQSSTGLTTIATANAPMLSLRKNVYAAFDIEINHFESLLLSHCTIVFILTLYCVI